MIIKQFLTLYKNNNKITANNKKTSLALTSLTAKMAIYLPKIKIIY